jgi:hypothetical protein
MRVPKRLLLGLGISGALLLLVVAALQAVAYYSGPMSRCRGHRAFAKAAWQDSALVYGALAVRGCMVDDLLSQRRFRGVARDEVVALLGEPRRTAYFNEYDLVYWLGPERGFISIDSEWLVFRLDAAGRVTEYRLVTD